jgi:hypothetical protein
VFIFQRGRDRVVGIATRYGGPGIESQLGRFSAPVQTSPATHSASYKMSNGSFPGVKQPGRGVNHPLPSSAEFKKSRAIHVFRLRAFVAGHRVNSTFTFISKRPPYRHIILLLCLYDAP